MRLDRDFVTNLKRLFESGYMHVQNDAALKVARLMYKDVTFDDKIV